MRLMRYRMKFEIVYPNESAFNDAAEAITEARNAVHELRSSTVVTNSLAVAVTALGEDSQRIRRPLPRARIQQLSWWRGWYATEAASDHG